MERIIGSAVEEVVELLLLDPLVVVVVKVAVLVDLILVVVMVVQNQDQVDQLMEQMELVVEEDLLKTRELLVVQD